jgi:hypothetical protein
MNRSVKLSHLVVGMALIATLLVASPALGGPSLKSLVKKEVRKQLAGKTGPQGPAGSTGLSGVHLVEVDSAFDTGTNPKVATANCAPGEVAIAGGGQVFVSAPTDTVALRTSGPVVGGDTQPTTGVPTGWRVNGVAIGSPGNWSDRAYAICAHTAG